MSSSVNKKTLKKIGSFRSTDGTEMYYEIRGEGDPIVFVYGIACLMNHWNHQVSYFSKNYKVITYDLRGHHKSGNPKDPSTLNLKTLGADLIELVQQVGLSQAHFVGHSFGVPVLLEAYKHNPKVFKSLAFINGFASNPIKNMFGLELVEPLFYNIKNQYIKNPEIWNRLWKWATHNPFTQWFTGLAGGFNLKLTQFKDIEIYTKGVAQVDLSVFIPLFEEMINFEGEEILKMIKVPTLILSGEKDLVTPLNYQEKMSLLISKSEWIVIPYGSHCCQLDFPEYVNLKLENFVKNLS